METDLRNPAERIEWVDEISFQLIWPFIHPFVYSQNYQILSSSPEKPLCFGRVPVRQQLSYGLAFEHSDLSVISKYVTILNFANRIWIGLNGTTNGQEWLKRFEPCNISVLNHHENHTTSTHNTFTNAIESAKT